MEREYCPYCSQPAAADAVALWDSRTYCRKCIEGVSPELAEFAASGSPLEDTVRPQDVRAVHYITLLGKYYLAFVGIVFGIPLGLVAIWKGEFLPLVFVLAFFGGGGFLFVTLQAAIGVFIFRRRLPRTVCVRDGELQIVTSKEKKSAKLVDCKWQLGNAQWDQLCLFTGLRRGIVIQTPEVKVACGHNPEHLKYWQAFFTLARIPQIPQGGCLRLIGSAGLGMVLGLVIGAGIGELVAVLTKQPQWRIALGFLGLLEGAAIALLYTTCTSEGFVAARKRLHPATLALAFLALGMQFGFVGGLPGALLCGFLNALVGAVVGSLCRLKIRAAELDHEVGFHLRR